MKALSLTQPFATGVALKLKKWETRGWFMSWRGEFAIHAAKGFPKWAKEFAEEMAELYGIPALLPQNLPLGSIVCLTEGARCERTEVISKELSPSELQWGDYGEKRFALELRNTEALAIPIPAKGALGFWEAPPGIYEQIVGARAQEPNGAEAQRA